MLAATTVAALALLLPALAAAQTAPLSDTGQTQCYNGTTLVPCTAANTGNTAPYPGQDGRFGRDAAQAAGALPAKTGGGAAGFDFTALDVGGNATTPGGHACVKDNVTGLTWEVKQNVPFARDEVIVDWEVLVQRTPEGQMEVVLVAAKREIVEQYFNVVKAAGLNPIIVDTAAFALQNAIEATVGFAPGQTIAVVNVGSRFSTIAMIRAGQPVFHRNIAAGGDTFTEAIRHRLAVSPEGAEAYKVGSGATTSAAEVVPQEVHRVLAQVSEQLAAEFQRTVDFYVDNTADAQLGRVYLTGGSALVPQLPKAIQDRARVPVEIFDPFSRVEVDARRFDVEYLRANAPVATVAFGLALRAVGDK